MASLIDFHSHILPCLDDGSQSVRQSMEMLDTSRKNGVTKIVATPHFYPNANEIDRFLKERDKSAEKLKPYLPNDIKVYVGAEVGYFRGIGYSTEIKKLCISGTDFIVIEMPFEPWSESVVNDVVDIKVRQGLIPIIAHVERYFFMQNKETPKYLKENGLLFQCNVGFLINPKYKKLVNNYIEKGYVDLIGSDCHNTSDRKPDYSEKVSSVFKDKRIFEDVCGFSDYILQNAVSIN